MDTFQLPPDQPICNIPSAHGLQGLNSMLTLSSLTSLTSRPHFLGQFDSQVERRGAAVRHHPASHLSRFCETSAEAFRILERFQIVTCMMRLVAQIAPFSVRIIQPGGIFRYVFVFRMLSLPRVAALAGISRRPCQR